MTKPRKLHNADTSTIGGRIERCMDNLGLTVKRLATAIYVSPETIKAWIHNELVPDREMLERLSVRFNIPPYDDWLGTGKHSPNPDELRRAMSEAGLTEKDLDALSAKYSD